MNKNFEEIWLKVVTKIMGHFYIQIKDCDSGVDYTVYNYQSKKIDNSNEIDGGIIDNCNSIFDVLEEIFNNESIEEIYLLEDASFENGKLHYGKCLKTTDLIGD